LALSRQAADQVCKARSENLSAKGAYTLHEAENGARDVTLLASGTEVGLAVAAREILSGNGIKAAVVSMPCWELFEAQDKEYRSATLGTAPRIGIEAALKFGWEKWLREDDAFIGMTGFGASDRAEKLYAHYGITTEAIVEAVRSALAC
jgi:transketolase